ncbi:MAG: sulfatase-like hydrolase/transferase, partial [Cyclobacteriaceae bacterium]|nr:sulfatase-like hydrolase/transferase [Cyclobacteriaceae bacterium]
PAFLKTIASCLLTICFYVTYAQTKPNVVLIFPDNMGVGELSIYGGVRGVPTPNIDRLAKEGIRMTNFNVEYSCIPSRVAILTGRYAVRAGNYSTGITLWETTIAEALQSVGYATALMGKYDVGGPNWEGRREPQQQGFDRWYGIPGTSHVSQFTSFPGFAATGEPVPAVWEGEKGSASKKVKPFDEAARRTIDREAAERGVGFIKESVSKKQPFFLYYPITQLHFPALPHPDKAGTTGAGDIGDSMADVDHNVGLILEAIDKLGIAKNTLVIFCTDNGAEMRRPWRGSSGPWRGFYNSAMEGGIRTPCVIRWPGRIPSGQVSNEMIHEVDLFATIAAAAGSPQIVPQDRAMDGVNQLAFLEGKQKKSNRESAIFMESQGRVMAVKWFDWKMWYDFRTELPDADPDNRVRLFDLRVDPDEEIDVKDHYPWVIGMMDGIVKKYEQSLVDYPRVAADATDPYTPPAKGSGSPVASYSRTDRGNLDPRSKAIAKPDFTGSWSTSLPDSRSPIGRTAQGISPTLGSGWGEKFSIVQKQDVLELERVMFVPREIQPPVRYRYNLNGSSSVVPQVTGRTGKAPSASATWEGDRLVITTLYPVQNPANGQWLEQKVTQTLWLQPATGTPYEPLLVVETSREGVLGGSSSVNRTMYSKGYR